MQLHSAGNVWVSIRLPTREQVWYSLLTHLFCGKASAFMESLKKKKAIYTLILETVL